MIRRAIACINTQSIRGERTQRTCSQSGDTNLRYRRGVEQPIAVAGALGRAFDGLQLLDLAVWASAAGPNRAVFFHCLHT